MEVYLAEDLHCIVRSCWATVENLSHAEHPAFRPHLEEQCEALARRFSGQAPASIPMLAAARELYRAIGVDPTKTRPSSEALLRRIIKGGDLYRLDPIVDTGNLFSLTASLPIGLYDADCLGASAEIRLGREGEGFDGIRKGRVNLHKRLCIADRQGPFGSPTSDSLRCSIRPQTRRALFVIYAPWSFDPELLLEQGRILASSFEQWNEGKAGEVHLLPPDLTA